MLLSLFVTCDDGEFEAFLIMRKESVLTGLSEKG